MGNHSLQRSRQAVQSGKFGHGDVTRVAQGSGNLAGTTVVGATDVLESTNGAKTIAHRGTDQYSPRMAASIQKQLIKCGFVVVSIAAIIVVAAQFIH
jgi:hypothetical protein